MKTVCELNMCTGCHACVEVCSQKAITIKDSLQSLNAIINETACVDCGACEKVCQQVYPIKQSAPSAWFQGWTTDESSRALSSSGGFAYNLMRQFILEGGAVCACLFCNGEVTYKITDREEDLELFRGSKYVKSNPKDIYNEIKKILREEKKVLFIGLPCHVAAVQILLGKLYGDRLFTVDLICHGSPSPVLLLKYLNEKKVNIEKISNIFFREKNRFRISLSMKDALKKKALTPLGVRDRFTIGFLNGLFYTENCYSCQYAGINRISDITIGDSWGSELEDTEEGVKGISLALCQTARGEALLRRSGLKLLSVDLNNAVEANHQLKQPMIPPAQREEFFSIIGSGKKVNTAIRKCYPKVCFRQDIKTILIKLHMI